ncbi:MAG TPA: threonine synthase [Acidimicrobiales bacterium]|nr:threonine synthase [Acidimicrobiales bacterium]
MNYVSTRGRAPVLGFDDALLSGLARDGGLYVPEWWPQLGPEVWELPADAPYAEVATRVMRPFLGATIDEDTFAAIVAAAYATFDHPEVCPLVPLSRGTHLLELFHGPTLAFKDVAMQVLGRLFDYVLQRRGERLTIVGATSGDTGSAAIEACRDRDALDIFILHPAGRVSEVQRRLMTTVDSVNVHNIAVEGTFDDCQDLVKAMFNDEAFRDQLRLSAVNSINWARIMVQVVYYVTAARALGAPGREVAFSVPSGNFGNAFAGFVARQMGVPIRQLIIGSNRNDILTRWLESGAMEITEVHATTSPAMDIQVSSNVERLLFELSGRDGEWVADQMARFRDERWVDFGPDVHGSLREVFDGARFEDDAVARVIAATLEHTGVLVDPHTAISLAAASVCQRDPSVPMVSMATAHPAKFPDEVEAATGIRPGLPERLDDLFDREEHVVTLPNDLRTIQHHVYQHARGVHS